MDVQAAVIFDEAELPKLVHEETHPGPRRPDHFGQGFLTDPGHHGLMLPVFAEAGQQQQNAREALLAGIEQLIDQVLFDPHIPRQQVRHEELGQYGLIMEHSDHGFFLKSKE